MLHTIDPKQSISKEEYEQTLVPHQVALHALGYQVYAQRRPVIIVYEGWDAAGKGGNIKRVTERLDPRGYVVHAIAAPRGDDKTHHYLWRFWRRLPEKGQIAIFDRSWYGRVMVERIEGFCTEEEWKRAYREINRFERQLVDFGTILFKFWIHISQEEQLRRFEAREGSQLKSWKLTDEDWRNRQRWEDYAEAVNEMLRKTSTLTAPWTIIEGDCKWFARIKALQTLVEGLSQELNYDPFSDLPSLRALKADGGKRGSEKHTKTDEPSSEKSALPMIQSFEFENIIIDGEEFETDVIITPDGRVSEWEREDEHKVRGRDIKRLLKKEPTALILGMGTVGKVELTAKAQKRLEEAEIEVLAYKTEKAIETYKGRREQEGLATLLHLGD